MAVARIFSMIVIIVCSGVPGRAQLSSVTLKSTDVLPRVRTIFEADKKPQVAEPIATLQRLRRADFYGDFNNCLKEIKQLGGKMPALAPWIANVELHCAFLQAEHTKKNADYLNTVVAKVEAHPSWLLKGPYALALRNLLIDAKMLSVEIDVVRNKTRAWSRIDELVDVKEWLTNAQQAKVYKMACELAFLQQNMLVARDFAVKSLALGASTDLEQKLIAIESSLSEVKTQNKAEAKNKEDLGLDASDDERDLMKRMTIALASNDFISAVEDGVTLIKEYPGGKRARWAGNKLLEIYIGLLSKQDAKYELLKARVSKQMESVDNLRQYEWGKELFKRRLYRESLNFLRLSLAGLNNTTTATNILSYAAQSAYNIDQMEEALKYYKLLVEKHAGTDEAIEALFYSAIIEVRRENYGAAVALFERLLALGNIDRWELSARYWLWRALQKSNQSRATEQQQLLVQQFPFTYYGLLAAAENNGGTLVMPSSNGEIKKLSYRMWLTPLQTQSWNRMLQLLAAGWLDEARLELKNIPAPREPQGKLLFARYWASAFGYVEAMDLITEVLRDNKEWYDKDVLALIFPEEFNGYINSESNKHAFDPILLRSLIRQESAYKVDAVSRSQAMGLMQLLTGTAEEVAADLRLKNFNAKKDIFLPEINIRLGSSYLAKLLRKFNRQVPLSLAAYNAGPGKLQDWINARPSLQGVVNLKSPSPMDELWIEELPWSETRFYVKAILRNALIYRMFRENSYAVGGCTWQFLLK